MATLTIRNLPDEVRDRLRLRAAGNGRSMEAEARALIAEAVTEAPSPPEDVRARVKRLQDYVARYIPPGSYSVDQFLAERREEAARDEARFARLEREAEEAKNTEAETAEASTKAARG